MYLRKGGAIEDTVGRKCLCNALAANVGLAQTRKDGFVEPTLVTLGSNRTTANEAAAELAQAEAARAKLIGSIALRVVGGRETLH